MTTSQLKLLFWGLAGLLGVGLSGYIGLYLANREVIEQPVTTEEMSERLNNVERIQEEAVDIVAYDDVRSAFHDLNWTGEKKVVEEVAEVQETRPPPTVAPVASLIRVIYLQANPEDACVVIQYLGNSGVQQPQEDGGLVHLRIGDHLQGPLAHIRLAAVRPDGAEFAFDDAAREPEVLQPLEYPLNQRIIHVAPGESAYVPPSSNLIRRSTRDYAPPKTTQLHNDRVDIGTEDFQHIADNYDRILGQEVRTKRHRDPRTGRYDGIEISQVAPGSTAAKHGLQDYDVVKSVNGHAVNSVSEVVSYIKNNADMHTGPWVVEVENMGRTRTMYYTPPGGR